MEDTPAAASDPPANVKPDVDAPGSLDGSEESAEDAPKEEGAVHPLSREERKREQATARLVQETQARLKQQIRRILKKDGPSNDAERAILEEHALMVEEERAAISRIEARKSRDEERTAEVEDSDAELQAKVEQLARMIKEAKHTVVYTGAGISTAAHIPDYRGPKGVWTLQKKGEQATMPVAYEETRPTGAHMALKTLVRTNKVRHVVSQNVDGLHLRSGIAPARLSELHGNIFVELCSNCGKRYLRPFHVTAKSSFRHHKTDRTCSVKRCKATPLRDTIVYFGEKLDDGDLERARAESEKADLAVFLGSSLKVLQHYKFIWQRARGQAPKRIVIVNLQWTPKDRTADLKIRGRCDAVLSRLLAALKLKADKYAEKNDPIAAVARSSGGLAPPPPDASARTAPKSRAFPSVVRPPPAPAPDSTSPARSPRRRTEPGSSSGAKPESMQVPESAGRRRRSSGSERGAGGDWEAGASVDHNGHTGVALPGQAVEGTAPADGTRAQPWEDDPAGLFSFGPDIANTAKRRRRQCRTD